MNSFKRDLLAINLSTLILGIAGLFAKWISLPAYVIIFGRSFFASFFLISLCWITKNIDLKMSYKYKGKLLLSSILMMLHWIFFYQAIQVSTVSIGVLSTFTFPLITSLLEPFFQKKSLQLKSILEACIILLGLYILLDFSSSSVQVVQGVFYGVLAALSFALRNLISQPLLENNMSSLWVMTCNVTLSSLILAPFCIIPILSTSSLNLILIVIAGVFVSGIGHSLFLQSMNSLSASFSSILASLQIPIAVIASWVFLGEVITPSILIGGGLIFSVVVFEQLNTIYSSS